MGKYLLKSRIVYIKSSEGTFHAVTYSVSGKEATKKDIEKAIRVELPLAGMIVFQKKRKENK